MLNFLLISESVFEREHNKINKTAVKKKKALCSVKLKIKPSFLPYMSNGVHLFPPLFLRDIKFGMPHTTVSVLFMVLV